MLFEAIDLDCKTPSQMLLKNKSFFMKNSSFKIAHLRRLYVFILVDNWYVVERLPKRDVLIFIVQFLFVVVGGAESLPRQCIDEQRVLLQVLLERVLLGYDDGRIVIVVNVVLVHRIYIRWRVILIQRRWCDNSCHRVFVLAVLGVVQLFVAEIFQREVCRVLLLLLIGGISRATTLPRAEGEDRAHFGGWLLCVTANCRVGGDCRR